MNGIRTITLDLDDTLWAIRPVIQRAEERLQAWLGEHYPRITERFTPEAIGELRARIVERYADRVHDLTFLRRKVLTTMATEAGYREFAVNEAFDVFDAVRNDVEIASATGASTRSTPASRQRNIASRCSCGSGFGNSPGM